jgi:hypothetical protein
MAETQRDDLTPLTPLLPLDEWKECRAAIGRLDGTLAGFRTYSFSLVTILITASAFATSFGGATLPPAAKAAVIIVLLVLTTVLFLVDRYYSLVQSGAVERALDIERQLQRRTDPQYLTEQISFNATNSRAPFVAMFLYLALAGALLGLGIAMFGWLDATDGLHTYLRLLLEASGRSQSSAAVIDWWAYLTPYCTFALAYVGLTGVMAGLCVLIAQRHRGHRRAKLLLFLCVLSGFFIAIEVHLMMLFGPHAPGAKLWPHAALLLLGYTAVIIIGPQRFWSAFDAPRDPRVSHLYYRLTSTL